MIESTWVPDDEHEENVLPSDEEDFERKLLMHCEAYALHEETSVGTSFDDESAYENEDESRGNFVLFQIDQEQQDKGTTTSDTNVVYRTYEENETGVEIEMQRLCESCAMDIADISEFDQCPFCLAAKQVDDLSDLRLDGNHDIHIEVSNSSDILDRKQHNTGVDCIKRMQEQQCRPSATGINNKDQFLKGIIATFLQQNKSAHGFTPTRKVEANEEDIIASTPKCKLDKEIIVRSQNESCASSITDDASDHSLTAGGGLISTHLKELKVSQAAIEKLALYTDLRRLQKLKKTEATPPTPSPVISEANKIGSGRFNGRSRVLKDLTMQHQHPTPNRKRFHQEPTSYKTAAEEINVRYNLLQLERYYSQQQ